MTPGYSGRSLMEKLGIRDSDRILLINPPKEYDNWLGNNISGQLCSKNELPDFIHLFAESNKQFEKNMLQILKRLKPATIIWVSWYKKNSGISTDLTENIIRNFALKNNLVDIKVCAVSDEWSGLKLVIPVAKRKII